MKRRDLLKLIAISPLTRALQAGQVTEVPPIKPGEIDVTANETEVFQFRKGEIKAFEVPDCKSMTIYAEEANDGDIFFGAEKDPAITGLNLRPGSQFIAKDVPAAHLYAVAPQDALMIVTFRS